MIWVGVGLVICSLFVMWHLATAPLGWEDEDGFHEEKED